MVPNTFHIQVDPSLSELRSWIEQNPATEKNFILVDHHTEKLCLPKLKQLSTAFANYKVITLPPGENNKNMDSVLYILKTLTDLAGSRKSILISLGGGVICDMGAFAASIYKRGIRSVLIPTTLLAQVDAAYGGKTGVDFIGHKNLIGSFSFPEKIFVSSQFLSTLPEMEKLQGVAEAFKHGLIVDRTYWNQIKNDPFENIEQLITDSIRIKTDIIEKDPTEKDLRKILNAGHTVGHAIESAFLLDGKPVPHGQAVAAGLIIELFISHQKGYLNETEMNEATMCIEKFFPKMAIWDYTAENIIQLMQHDKKNSEGNISFSLIRRIGEATWDDQVSEEIIKSGIQYYISR